MKDNWLEIYDILSYCINNGVMESTYQREIENCFKILGWRKTNGTLQSQVPIPIGSNNFIRPDIVFQKENENGNIVPVIAVEIKRPDNIKSERQELQLFSYMRQLRLNFGLYIGEKIQLYYDAQDNKENPIATPVPVINEHIPESNSSQTRDTTRFSFDGGAKYYNKRKFVLEIIKDYIQKHPGITFNEMEKVFYPEIHSRSRGVIKRYEEVQQMETAIIIPAHNIPAFKPAKEFVKEVSKIN